MSARSSESFDSSKIQQLSRMLDLDATTETGDWLREDFSAILEHQLAASLEAELTGIDSQIGTKLEVWRRQLEHPLERFSDLLAHPQPPVELLSIAKRFAKRAKASANGFLPDEVATVLYFSCIAVGAIRCDTQISRMGKEKLLHGLAWTDDQEWVERPIRTLIEQAIVSLGPNKPEGPAVF